jgi:hypothetical protein
MVAIFAINGNLHCNCIEKDYIITKRPLQLIEIALPAIHCNNIETR